MPEWKSIPYGKPLANQGFMIMDSMMQNCPVWVEGELYITGDSLADGYWGETELTRNSFVSINGAARTEPAIWGVIIRTGILNSWVGVTAR